MIGKTNTDSSLRLEKICLQWTTIIASRKILFEAAKVRVWLVHTVEDNKLRFQIDSDAHIVRGLLKILLVAINNLSPSEIIETDLETLFEELGLMAHLSMSRGNGLRAMISKINQIAENGAS